MAQDTLIELVSDLITETGLNGGNAPSSVESAEGDAAKAVYWVQQADLQIQRERIDWDFLWGERIANLTQDSAIVPSPVETYDATDPHAATVVINAMPKNKLAVIDSNGEPTFPTWLEWNEFATLYAYKTQDPDDFPSHWSIRPDRVIVLSCPIASPDMRCRYEYWRKPLKMRNTDSVSRIPDDFSRLIVLLAKIMYAEHEDAPEVDVGSTAHYDIMFNQMLSVHTAMSQWQRLEHNDEYLEVSAG